MESPATRQHRSQFTLDQCMFMVVNYCNTNGARTMAFMIMAKVAHIVFTIHYSKDHNFCLPHNYPADTKYAESFCLKGDRVTQSVAWLSIRLLGKNMN